MVASLWPHRLPFAAVSKRSTSVSVRYSRVRRSALGPRLGVTVRFTVAGVTSLRCDLAMGFALPVLTTVRTKALFRIVASGMGLARGWPVGLGDPPPSMDRPGVRDLSLIHI